MSTLRISRGLSPFCNSNSNGQLVRAMGSARGAQSVLIDAKEMKADIVTLCFLTGWSLGGFLSLAMARVIASDPASYSISVAGLLIIDSPYHIARSKITVPTSKAELPGLPALVEKSFDNCDDMLQDWDLPSWDSPDGGGGCTDAQFTVGGKTFRVPNGEVLRKPANSDPLDNNWETVAVKPYKMDPRSNTPGTGAAGSPPPAVLLRCIKRAKPKSNLGDRHGLSQGQGQGHNGDTPGCLVDLFRHETLLGWEARYPDFIKAVIDVDADHYNLFERTDTVGLERVTAQILKALEILDSMHIEARKVGRVF